MVSKSNVTDLLRRLQALEPLKDAPQPKEERNPDAYSNDVLAPILTRNTLKDILGLARNSKPRISTKIYLVRRSVVIKKSVTRRLAELIHVISAFWVLFIACIIFVDVVGRQFFNSPLLGTTEIIKNSVVAITFMQLPLAIYSDTMLQTTLIYGRVRKRLQKYMRTLSNILGFLFFIALVYSSWEPFTEALAIGEYEGEGALRVPTYPVRFLIILTSAFAAFVYLYLMIMDWTGRLEDEDFDPADTSHHLVPEDPSQNLNTQGGS